MNIPRGFRFLSEDNQVIGDSFFSRIDSGLGALSVKHSETFLASEAKILKLFVPNPLNSLH